MEHNKVVFPFDQSVVITQIESKKKEEFAFLGLEIMKISHHKNLTQAIQDAKCISGVDYYILKRTDHPKVFVNVLNLFCNSVPDSHTDEQKSVFNGKNVNKIHELTLLYESGVWKLAINSKLPSGDAMREWLSTSVLPSIRKTGSYSLKTIDTNRLLNQLDRAIQIQNSKDVNTFWFEQGGREAVIKYNIDNCLQVAGKYPNQVKGTGSSAKEKLRKTKPELAATMSLNDTLVVQDGVKLSDLKEIDRIAVALFIEFEKIGITFQEPKQIKEV